MAGNLSVNPHDMRVITSRVLNVWSGYQLGIDFNSGGPETREKHEWFIDTLTEFIVTSSGLKADDLEEWIDGLLNSEFDLILDDESTYPTSLLLLEAYGYLKKSDTPRLEQLLAGLPSLEVVQEAKKASRREAAEGEEDMEMGDLDEDMEDEEDDDQPKRERQPRTVTDDDGWTTILKR